MSVQSLPRNSSLAYEFEFPQESLFLLRFVALDIPIQYGMNDSHSLFYFEYSHVRSRYQSHYADESGEPLHKYHRRTDT